MLTRIFMVCLSLLSGELAAQDSAAKVNPKQRLDFAKTYFEAGGFYMPSFTGKSLDNGDVASFNHSASVLQYLTWGAFHFWGHAEFYVNFPLGQLNISGNEEISYRLDYSVVTGARFYPWPMREQRLRPYVGLDWGVLDFQQVIAPEKNQPMISKDFLINFEAGMLYNYRNFGVRLALRYFSDTDWNYPLSKTQKASIKTPPLTASLGVLYALDLSKDNKKERIDRWNSYPRLSKLSYEADKFGDFFIGVGPSLSFSLERSGYNQEELPYLKDRLSSNGYIDIAVGYHFNKANLFTALTFRNPKFKTEGFGDQQTIRKTSFTFEVNKFLMDYTGFAPFVGLNIAYDKLNYYQQVGGIERRIVYDHIFEPGLTFGWDIVPGKTEEALILRTNLRWYPFQEFSIDGKKFEFGQLEYNLIQAVFYPERLKKKRR